MSGVVDGNTVKSQSLIHQVSVSDWEKSEVRCAYHDLSQSLIHQVSVSDSAETELTRIATASLNPLFIRSQFQII